MNTQISKRNLPGLMCLLLAPLVFLSACGGGGGGSTDDGNAMPSLADRMVALESSLRETDGQFPEASDLSDIVDFPTGLGEYTFDVLGYAYCEPSSLLSQIPDPLVATGTTTVYGCSNNLALDYSIPSSSTVTITLIIPYIYIDASVGAPATDHEGYVAVESVTVTIDADIISNPDGSFEFDSASAPVVNFGTPIGFTVETTASPLISGVLSSGPAGDLIIEGLELALSELMFLELQKLKSFMF